MINILKKLNVLLPLLALLVTACSAPVEGPDSANGNSAQPSAGQQSGATATAPAPDARSTAMQPAVAPAESKPGPNVVKANGQVTTGPPASSPGAQAASKAPKLIVPVKKIDFGKQPKEKTLVRTFTIKNTGNAALEVRAVEPS